MKSISKEDKAMTTVTNAYLTANQVMEILDVSRTTAYKVIKEMNEELLSKGYRIRSGRIPKKYFEEKYYGMQIES